MTQANLTQEEIRCTLNNPMKYNFKVITIRDFSKYKNKERKEIIIVREYSDSDAWIPSQLTSYLKTMCCTMSDNSKIKEARFIINFLNYINNEISLGYNRVFDVLKEKGLYGLNLYHLAEFINSLRDKNSFETVKAKENILLKFYDYLYKLGITGEDAKIEQIPVPIKTGDKRRQVRWQMVNPFKGNPNYVIDYPDNERVHSGVKKDLDEDVWHAFIKYARDNYPNIAFGVAIQICGGLRQGEVVNLTMDAVELNKDKNYISLFIMDRQSKLFTRKVDTRFSQVKKSREGQPVFNFTGELFDMWDEHVKYLNNLSKRDNMSALFVDSYGQPMTGQVYQKEFHKLKWKFIKEFMEVEKPSMAEELKIESWGSHIGRHIFTNHLIKKGYLKNIMGYSDPKLLMILRGDSSTKSSEVYLDKKAITESIASQIDVVSSIAVSMKNK